jgi:hypothetical protein
MNRRALIFDGIKLSAGTVLSQTISALAQSAGPIEIKLAAGSPVTLPENFIGLGYEMSSVARPKLLSTGNREYVSLVKGLGSNGVIRVGGIVADYTRYDANGAAKWDKQDTVIPRANLVEFRGFLDEVGWSAIWSLNFAQGSLSDAVEEAKAVSSALGHRLLAFELGNEVENYGRGKKPFRPSPYSYATFREEYSKWHAAIASAVPNARYAAPDTASSVEWAENMAKDARGDVQLLTTHYYRNGQGRGSADQLINPDPRLTETLKKMHTASERSGIPWRLCETNSFSGGGRPGVSDTFLGALWTLDFLLQLAVNGCSGVNIETGVNQLGFLSYYSPIRDDENGRTSAGPPYYGMLAFAFARRGCSQMFSLEVPRSDRHITAYALGEGGKPSAIVLINRDADLDAQVPLAGFKLQKARVYRLSAPSLASTTGITFAGEQVSADGDWKPAKSEPSENNIANLPRASVAVICSH